MAQNTNQPKYFTVLAGRKEPAKVLTGTLNKDTGLPNADAHEVRITVGKLLIPNHSIVWAKRVIEPSAADAKKKKATTEEAAYDPETSPSVAVTDPKYRGKLKFMKWLEPGGEAIHIRYTRRSGSLDTQYQELVEKLKPRDEEAFLELEQGINNFDERENPLLVEMIRRHTLNSSSESRDPNNNEYEYSDYSPSKRNQSKVQLIMERNIASDTVIEAQNSPGALKVLGVVFGIDNRMQDDIIFEQLLEKSELAPTEFMSTLVALKQRVFTQFRDAEDAGLLDLTVPDKIMYLASGRRDILLNGVEADEADKLKWVSQNVLQPEVYEAYVKLDAELKAYRNSLN